MRIYDMPERVEAIGHTQKAIDALSSLTMKDPALNEMVAHLQTVRKELAYEIFRVAE